MAATRENVLGAPISQSQSDFPTEKILVQLRIIPAHEEIDFRIRHHDLKLFQHPHILGIVVIETTS